MTDDFLDGQLFNIIVAEPADINEVPENTWMMDMINFLSTELPSPNMTRDERKELVVHN